MKSYVVSKTYCRTEMLVAMMENLVSPEQKKLAEAVIRKGGPMRVMEDDDLLKEFSAQGSRNALTMTGDSRSRGDFDKLKTELRTDPAAVIQMNLQAFEGKFAIQKRQIIEDIDRTMKRESDRVIELVTCGPHDRIVDKVSLHVICGLSMLKHLLGFIYAVERYGQHLNHHSYSPVD